MLVKPSLDGLTSAKLSNLEKIKFGKNNYILIVYILNGLTYLYN